MHLKKIEKIIICMTWREWKEIIYLNYRSNFAFRINCIIFFHASVLLSLIQINETIFFVLSLYVFNILKINKKVLKQLCNKEIKALYSAFKNEINNNPNNKQGYLSKFYLIFFLLLIIIKRLILITIFMLISKRNIFVF